MAQLADPMGRITGRLRTFARKSSGQGAGWSSNRQTGLQADAFAAQFVRRAPEKRSLVLEVRALRDQLEQRDRLEGKMIGRAPCMQKIRSMVACLADKRAIGEYAY